MIKATEQSLFSYWFRHQQNSECSQILNKVWLDLVIVCFTLSFIYLLGKGLGRNTAANEWVTLIDDLPLHIKWFSAVGAFTGYEYTQRIPGPFLNYITKLELFVKDKE